MDKKDRLEEVAVFGGKEIRRVWDKKSEKWFFSVVDVIAALTGSSIPKRYWSDLKKKIMDEGSQVYEKIVHLKFLSSDGKLEQLIGAGLCSGILVPALTRCLRASVSQTMPWSRSH